MKSLPLPETSFRLLSKRFLSSAFIALDPLWVAKKKMEHYFSSVNKLVTDKTTTFK
jgi:hypothetical protein